MTAQIIYKGDLRCECTHLQSGTIIETDAPTDNRGKGERFSPTDTVCVALATCIITTMGIKAADMNIDLTGTKIDVTKHMLSEPRRIGKIEITLHMQAPGLSEKDQQLLQRVGETCPVAKSLHPDLNVVTKFIWNP
jgi:putative redox protein